MTQQKPVYGPTLNRRLPWRPAWASRRRRCGPAWLPQEVNLRLGVHFVPLVSRAAVDQAVVDIRAVAAAFEAAKLTRRGLFIFSTEPGPDGATATAG